MMSPFSPYGQSWPSVGATTTWIENAQGQERVRISVTAKEKLKFWPTEAVVQYRLREQGAHAKPLLAKLEDHTERFRLVVEAIDLALAGQPHDDDDDDGDNPSSKTGDNARAEEARFPSPVSRTSSLAFPTNAPPPPWATMTPPTQTRTPTTTRGNDDDRDADEDPYRRVSGATNVPPPPWATMAPPTQRRTPTATRGNDERDRDADEDPYRRVSGGGLAFPTNAPPPPWATMAPPTQTRTPTATRGNDDERDRGRGRGRDADEDPYRRGGDGGGRPYSEDFARTASGSSPPRGSDGGRSFWDDFARTASGSSPPPPFSLPPSARRPSNLPSASVLSARGGAYAVAGRERLTPKRPLSLKELCEGLVVSAVGLDNVMDVLSAVGRHSDVVKEHCLKFIGRNFCRARKVKEIRAALEEPVGAFAEWDTAAVRRHIENTPRVRVEAVVLGPKEKDNNAMPTYGQPTVQPPGFSAYRDCYVVIPLPPRAATEAAGPTDDAEAALEANRRVTGVIDSLLRHSFLPYQLQLAQNHLSFAYSTSQFVAKFVSHAKTDPLPEEVMKRLRDKAHGIALAQATAQGLGTLRLRSTNVSGHVQRKAPTDIRSPMDIAVGLSSQAYAPIVYQAQLHAAFDVTPAQP